MQATNHPKDNFHWWQFPGGYCQEEIIFGVIFKGAMIRGQSSRGGGNFSQEKYPRGQSSGGIFPLGQLSGEH